MALSLHYVQLGSMAKKFDIAGLKICNTKIEHVTFVRKGQTKITIRCGGKYCLAPALFMPYLFSHIMSIGESINLILEG